MQLLHAIGEEAFQTVGHLVAILNILSVLSRGMLQNFVVCLSFSVLVYVSVCLSVFLSVCVFVCLFVCLSVCLCVCLHDPLHCTT